MVALGVRFPRSCWKSAQLPGAVQLVFVRRVRARENGWRLPVTYESRPSLTLQQIILMNFGFFGIQHSFGMQQTAINPCAKGR